MEARYYNETTAIVDPSYGGYPIYVQDPSVPEPEEGTKELDVWKHYGPCSAQIDIKSVAWQLSNNPQFPQSPTVSVEELKKGEPYTYRELNDARESGGDSGGGGDKPSGGGDSSEGGGGGSIDPSGGGDIPLGNGSKIVYDKDKGYYYDVLNGTSNDPSNMGYDENNNGIPDLNEWSVIH